MKKLKQLLFVVVMAVSVVGCATKRDDVLPPSSFYSKPDSIVIVHKTDVKHPYYAQTGKAGLLDYAINSAICRTMSEGIEKFECAEVINTYYLQYFEHFFKLKNFAVIVEKEPLYKEDASEFGTKEPQYAPYDFTFLKDKYKVNYALVLNVNNLAITREYYGFIPVSKPHGLVNDSFYLVNLSNNTIIGEFHAAAQQKALDGWDAPPTYPELEFALNGAFREVLLDGQEFFSQ